MMIDRVDVIPLGYMKDYPSIPRSFALVRVATDSGIIGYGEASSSYGHSYPLVVKSLVDNVLARVLVKKDPTCIDALLADMRRYVWPYLGWEGGANSVIGAVEIALWDIVGKAEGKPICQLLGGKPQGVPLYATGTTYFEMSADWHAAFFDRALHQGIGAIKVRVGHNREWDLALARTVRQYVGPNVDLMVDAFMTYGRDTALAMTERLSQYDIAFLEEPVPQFELDVLSELVEKSSIPIALGERVYSPYGFAQVIKARAAHILQPDVTIVGGFLSFGEVCRMASAHRLPIVPHSGGLTAVGIAANLQAYAANANCELLEYDLGPYQPLRDDLIREPVLALERVKDGMQWVPDGPGLGIEVDESKFSVYPYSPGAVYPDVYSHYGSGRL